MAEKRTVLITGTSSGIGLHAAVLAAKRGHQVVATMRNTSKAGALVDAAAKAGVEVAIERLDVQDLASVEACVQKVISTYGRIDVLVNNAGFGSVRFLEQATDAQIHEVFDVNVYGVMRCTRAVLPHMRSRGVGHIISVSSVGGLVGQPMNEIYCSAKFAVEGFMETLATYLEPYFGIHASLVEPAATKSEFVGRVMGDIGGELPADSAYGPIARDYMEALRKNGSFSPEKSQEASDVGRVIVDCFESPAPRLRNLTSAAAAEFCVEKLAGDPTGAIQTARIRAQLLGK